MGTTGFQAALHMGIVVIAVQYGVMGDGIFPVGGDCHFFPVLRMTADGRVNSSLILPDIAASIERYLEEKSIDKTQVLGIGMGVPGAVTPAGIVNKCINLGWGVVDARQQLERLTGLPVTVGNDATVAALGECWKGGGAGCDSMVLVTLGTGVGGGIVVGGNVIHGAHGAGGEIGHIVLEPEETERCNCGNYGCAEQYCSATGIVRLAKKALAESSASSVLSGKDFTCKDIFDGAAAGDEVSRQVLEQVYEYLARLVGSLCNVVNPEAVVFGGGVSKAGEPLLEGVSRHLGKYIFHAASSVELRLATLGNDAGAYGAFRLIWQN